MLLNIKEVVLVPIRGLEVKLHTFFMFAFNGCEWSASHSRYFTSERESLIHIIKKKRLVITLWEEETN
jgi:hypothetical protein